MSVPPTKLWPEGPYTRDYTVSTRRYVELHGLTVLGLVLAGFRVTVMTVTF